MGSDKGRLLSVLCAVLGALSFLMLLPGLFWWAGLLCAVAAVLIGRRRMLQPARADQILAISGTVLAVLGAGSYLFTTVLH